jgi:protein TonB
LTVKDVPLPMLVTFCTCATPEPPSGPASLPPPDPELLPDPPLLPPFDPEPPPDPLLLPEVEPEPLVEPELLDDTDASPPPSWVVAAASSPEVPLPCGGVPTPLSPAWPPVSPSKPTRAHPEHMVAHKTTERARRAETAILAL